MLTVPQRALLHGRLCTNQLLLSFRHFRSVIHSYPVSRQPIHPTTGAHRTLHTANCALQHVAPTSGTHDSSTSSVDQQEHHDAVVQLPTYALGQVVYAASNYVRVELSQLGLDPATPSPPLALAPRRQLLCSVRAVLRKLQQSVLVGDRVRVAAVDWGSGRAVVDGVMERTSELLDPAVANVDHLLLVLALDQPPFEEQQVTRFLISAEGSGLTFSLVLNKSDLVPPDELERRVEQCRSWGYEPVILSCETGRGVEQIAGVLAGRTSVVAGPSGAGKSSLINTLRMGKHRPDLSPDQLHIPDSALEAGLDFWGVSDGEDEQEDGMLEEDAQGQNTAEERSSGEASSSSSSSSSSSALERLREGFEYITVGEMSKIGRGMHTTTSVTLIKLLGGGLLADTPGFGQPTLDRISSTELSSLFPEFSQRLETEPCRFNNCQHVNEPGCSISSQGFERYPFYLKFYTELKAREEYDVKVLQLGKKLREGAGKVKSGVGGRERVEVRLDPRKHRRESRQAAKQRMLSGFDE